MAVVVVVDTETTGLGKFSSGGPRPDGVVQVGLAWRHPSRGIQVWERLCNPGPEFLEQGRANVALELSGLTPAQILSAPRATEVAKQLRAVLTRIRQAQGRVDLRAFNVAFDKSFLSVKPWNLLTGWGPCLMIEAAQRFGYDTGRVGLARAVAHVGLSVEGRAHTAGVDARTALRLHEHFSAATGKDAKEVRSLAPSEPAGVPVGGNRAGCELCENTGPHTGEHGYFQEGEFYAFDE